MSTDLRTETPAPAVTHEYAGTQYSRSYRSLSQDKDLVFCPACTCGWKGTETPNYGPAMWEHEKHAAAATSQAA